MFIARVQKFIIPKKFHSARTKLYFKNSNFSTRSPAKSERVSLYIKFSPLYNCSEGTLVNGAAVKKPKYKNIKISILLSVLCTIFLPFFYQLFKVFRMLCVQVFTLGAWTAYFTSQL